MNIKDHGHHFIAIFGGAVAGAEAALLLSQLGFKIVVFDQGLLPYGKIEDGLPKWHAKLRDKEERNIDQKLNHPNIMFVPGVKLGRDIHFREVLNWGFSAVILATGAWKDRPLPIEGIDVYNDKNLIYQNNLLKWFNHKHEPDYDGPQYEMKDGTIVIGGGLASLDVVKIVMIETVQKALKDRGIEVDMFKLDHGISKVLESHGLTLRDLNLKSCTLYYRRRAQDMPLTPMPTDTPEKLQKAQTVRQKILENFLKKYLFSFEACSAPYDKIVENGALTGIRFQRTKIADGKLAYLDEYFDAHAPLIISSIGSIPEKIEGISRDGAVFKIKDPKSCRIDGFNNVFAIGNAVTGKGNINESIKHSREVSGEIIENILDRQQEDYENWHRSTATKVQKDISEIVHAVEHAQSLSDDIKDSIIAKVKKFQKKSGYTGDYEAWIKDHLPVRLEDLL